MQAVHFTFPNYVPRTETSLLADERVPNFLKCLVVGIG